MLSREVIAEDDLLKKFTLTKQEKEILVNAFKGVTT